MIRSLFFNNNKKIRLFIYFLISLLLIVSPVNIALLLMYILTGMFIGCEISKLLG